MSGLGLRLYGNFIDIAPPSMSGLDDTDSGARKRSDSAPPSREPQGANFNPNAQARLVSLFQRAENIQDDIGQVDALLAAQEMSSGQDASSGAEATNEGHPSGEDGEGGHTTSDASDPSGGEEARSENHLSGEVGEFRHMPSASSDPQSGGSSAANAASPPVTTLMLCGLPCSLLPEEIVDVINQKGFSNDYDLIYVPHPQEHRTKKSKRRNLGYGFVNFKTPEAATAFAHIFKNFAFPGASTKLSFTKPAHLQGFDANYKSHLKEGTACFLYCTQASSSGSQAAAVQPGVPGHYCSVCRTSWRAGDDTTPPGGTHCGQQLRDGVLQAQ